MTRLITCFFFLCVAAGSHAQNTAKEKVVMAYYTGFEKKDWNTVAGQFADDFTFTSPNNDDHLSIEKFKNKCWGTAKFVKKVNYIKMVEKADNLMLLVEIISSDGKLVRNVDVFTFNHAGKINSIEVFFGAGSKYPGNKG